MIRLIPLQFCGKSEAREGESRAGASRSVNAGTRSQVDAGGENPEQHLWAGRAGASSSTTCLLWGFPGAAQGFTVSGSAPGHCQLSQPGHLPPGLGSGPAFWLCRKHFWEPQPGAGAANLLSSGFLLCKQLTHPGKELLQDLQIEKPLRGQEAPSEAHANPHTQSFVLFQILSCEGPHLSPPQNPRQAPTGHERRGLATPCGSS